MHTIGDLPYPPKRLKPVKEMLLQEDVYLTVVGKLSTALLHMVDPVPTGVLNFEGNTLLDPISLGIDYEHVRGIHATDVLLERCRHKLYTMVC
jgi:hypothetical protein